MDEEITVEVPIHVIGEAIGVKDQSGVLALLLRTVEVSCLPRAHPGADRRRRVGAPHPRRGDRREPPAPGGGARDDARAQPVATVAPPMAEEVVATAAAPAAEPEVVTERKPKDEDEAKGKEEGKGKK